MTAERKERQQRDPLLVIPGGLSQAPVPAPPADLYRGAYHLACRRAALALTSTGRVLVLSAKHGLVRLDDAAPLEPYEDRMPTTNYLCDPGGHQRRARAYATEHGLLDESPIVLGGRAHLWVCWSVWRRGIVRPLERTRTIGEQFAVLRAIEEAARLPALELAS